MSFLQGVAIVHIPHLTVQNVSSQYAHHYRSLLCFCPITIFSHFELPEHLITRSSTPTRCKQWIIFYTSLPSISNGIRFPKLWEGPGGPRLKQSLRGWFEISHLEISMKTDKMHCLLEAPLSPHWLWKVKNTSTLPTQILKLSL